MLRSMGLHGAVKWLVGASLVLIACGDDTPGDDTEGADTGTSTGMNTTMMPDDTTGMMASTGEDSTGSKGSSGGSTDTGDTTGGSDSTGDDTTTGGVVPPDCTDPAEAEFAGSMRSMDILFVVDNSGTMGLAQARLAAAMDSFAARLDNEGVDFRIAVTTTDIGNPWCSGTTPEGGRFVATSCRSRAADFVSGLGDDVTDEACLDVCVHDDIALTPTTTANDPNAVVRPWIERIGDTTNLPEGVTPAEALSCLVPQGIAGCGFERTLESMYRGILRATMDTEEEFDFFRDGADSLIVIVTDEVDCSHDTQYETIFLPDGDRVFWSDPTSPAPTSAVCWNAGVECTGSSPYDECHSQNYDAIGNPGVADGDAVLYALSRYGNGFATLDAANGSGSVRMALIAGVPDDYPDGGEITYADSMDDAFQNSFGIGPGCDDGQVVGIPPVRMRELADSVASPGMPNVFSICSADYCDELERAVDDLVQ